MTQFAQRLGHTAIVLLLVSFFASTLLNLVPGNPAYAIIGDGATPAEVAALDKQLDWGQGLLPQYVTSLISQAAPVTIELIILSQIVALAYAFATGIYSAYRPGRIADRLSAAFSFGSISIPVFVLGILLILLFAVKLEWVPVAGFVPLSQSLGGNLRSMVLPALTVAAAPAGIYQRLLRNDVGATLNEDYISMAEAKGLSTARILVRHSVRPSLFSMMTLIGLTMAQALGGSVVIETMFGLPGLGALLINSLQSRDYGTVQGIVLVIALAYVVVNFLLDYLYRLVDPRVHS
jgi:peptide/nickel transport system permease protein